MLILSNWSCNIATKTKENFNCSQNKKTQKIRMNKMRG